jgi:MFS family permease
VPLWGMIGDRIGRKRVILIGAVAMLVLAYPYWVMLDTRMPAFVAVAILLGLLVQDIQFGPQAAFIPETFTGRLRYSGSSLSYQLSAGLVGGIGPLIATGLLQRFHSSAPIAFYMIACTLVSVGAILFLKDNSTRDLAVEYDEEPAPAPAAVSVSS